MTTLDSLRQQLEQAVAARRHFHGTPAGFRFACIEDLVLQFGRVFTPRQSPFAPTAKHCFWRSYQQATRKRSPWVYVEGYGARPKALSLSMHHAWVTRADDPTGAYDLAWDDPFDCAYIGIPLRASYVRHCHMASKRLWTSALDTFWMGYPLLSGEDRIEDAIENIPENNSALTETTRESGASE